MYPDPEVVELITREFVPVKFHVKEQPEAFERFRAAWTPTQISMDSSGLERHRIEGFLAKDDFLAQLEIGLGRVAMESGRLEDGERWFRGVVDRRPMSAAAAEAAYWAGVARYKKDHSGETLRRTAQELMSRYPNTEWAKKASVWAA